MRPRRHWAPLGVLAVSALLLSACSSGSSGSATPAVAPVESAPAETAEDAAAESDADYVLGDTGPGGGIIFYDAGSMQSWGRFLEAGPLLGQEQWCGDDPDVDVAGTKDAIGAGAANTELMLAACEAGAALMVSEHDGGGMTDWFLPSKGELNALYAQRETVGGFGLPGNDWSSFETYWSSTQSDETVSMGFTDVAWAQDFDGGAQRGDWGRGNSFGVRPVRAF